MELKKPWIRVRISFRGDRNECTSLLNGRLRFSSKKGQKTLEGYNNIDKMLKPLVPRGVEAKICGFCIDARGISEVDFVEGVMRSSMDFLDTFVKESERALFLDFFESLLGCLNTAE